MDQATNATLHGTKAHGTVAQATAATLETLMMTSLEANATTTTLVGQTTNANSSNKTSKAFANAWRGAAAFHFYMLALASYQQKFYGICSQAFVKLETLPNLDEKIREDIETLAVKIFSANLPADPAILPEVYLKCLEVGKSYKACIITGRYY